MLVYFERNKVYSTNSGINWDWCRQLQTLQLSRTGLVITVYDWTLPSPFLSPHPSLPEAAVCLSSGGETE